jgi:hypothetical protein
LINGGLLASPSNGGWQATVNLVPASAREEWVPIARNGKAVRCLIPAADRRKF